MFNSFMMGGGFGAMFHIVFLIMSVIIIITFIKAIGQWNKNNNSPRLTVKAKIVTKRRKVNQHNHHNSGIETGFQGVQITTDTTYYVTFEVQSKDRIELKVSGSQYGMLVEGDVGELSFQGTRYLEFVRSEGVYSQ